MRAAWNGKTELVSLLVASGADLSISSQDGWTALTMACSNNHRETAAALLRLGAEVNTSDNVRYHTTLHYTALH